jgi:hypothetical protein
MLQTIFNKFQNLDQANTTNSSIIRLMNYTSSTLDIDISFSKDIYLY